MITYRFVTDSNTWTTQFNTEEELRQYIKPLEKELVKVEKWVSGPGVQSGWYQWNTERNVWIPK